MNRIPLLFLALAVACVLHAAPASAQTRVFVSSLGSDANACTSVGHPCRTMQHAHDVVVAGGEIDVLDPAGYGSLIIEKSISIQGHGWAGISAAAGSDAITISAGSSDVVSLHGLIIEGSGTGRDGIIILSVHTVDIHDSVIRNFSTKGIQNQATPTTNMFVHNTRIFSIGQIGIDVVSTGGSFGVIDHVVVTFCGSDGIGFLNFARYTITDSVISGNARNGISNGSTDTITIRNSTVTNNANVGLVVASGSTAKLTRSTFAGNTVDLDGAIAGQGGNIITFGDNVVDDNTLTSSTVPLR